MVNFLSSRVMGICSISSDIIELMHFLCTLLSLYHIEIAYASMERKANCHNVINMRLYCVQAFGIMIDTVGVF